MRKYFFTVTCLSLLLVACKPLVEKMDDSGSTTSTQSEVMEKDDSTTGAIMNGYMHYQEGVLENGETKVLFFHAAWCPYCIEKDENLRAWYKTEQIPINTYRIDFDTATELKQQFGVAMQDTFVVVDGSGKVVTTLSAPSLGDLKRVLYGNMDKAMENPAKEAAVQNSSEATNSQFSSAAVVQSSGKLTAYQEGVIGNGNSAVLFFHAQWCPYCLANEKRLNDWYSSGDYPISTYKIDYDTAIELKNQFNVVQQDTFILIDGSGKEVSRVSFPSETALKDIIN